MIIATLSDFEMRLNKESEKNAFLESELDEKNNMEITVQRLRDEARDLSQELHVRQLKQQQSTEHEKLDNKENTKDEQPPQMMTPPGKLGNCKRLSAMSNGMNNNNPTTSTPHHNNATTPTHHDSRRVLLTGNMDTLQSSPRVYALSIVGDLLRKVGALESKLASCRNIVLDQSSRSHSTSTTSSHNANENNNNNLHHQKAKLKV